MILVKSGEKSFIRQTTVIIPIAQLKFVVPYGFGEAIQFRNSGAEGSGP